MQILMRCVMDPVDPFSNMCKNKGASVVLVLFRFLDLFIAK